jgi:GNAT superfamily N-acetyltransferase
VSVADRVAAAYPEGLRSRALAVEGGEALEVDGLVLGLTNLPAEELNSAGVLREPADPGSALVAAEEVFRSRGHPFFGIELEPGRFPRLEAAVRDAGLARLLTRPAMAGSVAGLRDVAVPDGVTIEVVRDRAALDDLRGVDFEAFGGDRAITDRFLSERWLDLEDCRSLLARDAAGPVGAATGMLLEDTVGVFGVGVVERARRRGIGAALTVRAARGLADRADLAWLLPSDMARALYGRLGFRHVSTWEIWIRPQK